MDTQLCWDWHRADPSPAQHRHLCPPGRSPGAFSSRKGLCGYDYPRSRAVGSPRLRAAGFAAARPEVRARLQLPACCSLPCRARDRCTLGCAASHITSTGKQFDVSDRDVGKHHRAGRWRTAALGSLLTPATVGVSVGAWPKACTCNAALLECSGAQQGCRSPQPPHPAARFRVQSTRGSSPRRFAWLKYGLELQKSLGCISKLGAGRAVALFGGQDPAGMQGAA